MITTGWVYVATVPGAPCLGAFILGLRVISAAGAAGILNGFGMDIWRIGTGLISPVPGAEFQFDVAHECSGILSLFALTALAAVNALLELKTNPHRIMLFACSIPLAIGGNIFRVLSICLVARWFGQDIAVGAFHSFSGLASCSICVILLLKIEKRIKRREQP